MNLWEPRIEFWKKQLDQHSTQQQQLYLHQELPFGFHWKRQPEAAVWAWSSHWAKSCAAGCTTIKLFEWISMHWLLVRNRKVLSCLGENNDCSDGMTPTSSISQNERIFDGAIVLGNIQRKQESPWTWKIANWLVGRVGLVGLDGVGLVVASHFFMGNESMAC